MNGPDLAPVLIARAAEMLRQERETFDQKKSQEERWFLLRLVMGYTSIGLLAVVIAIATLVLINNRIFPATVLSAAGAALFVDVVGLLIGVWKIALNPNFMTRLSPVTKVQIPSLEQPADR